MNRLEDRLWSDLAASPAAELLRATQAAPRRHTFGPVALVGWMRSLPRSRRAMVLGVALLTAGGTAAVALALTAQTQHLPPAQIRALARAHVPYVSASFPSSETGLPYSFGVWVWRSWEGQDKGMLMEADGTSVGVSVGGCQEGKPINPCGATVGPTGYFVGTVASSVRSLRGCPVAGRT